MMHLAQKAAEQRGRHKCHFHGAVVTRGGAVVAVGYNHGSIHAEENALSKLWPSERKGCRVWSIRVRRTGKVGLAKPCESCEQLMRENGIKVVFYTTNEGTVERLKL